MLSASGLTKHYADLKAVKGVDFEVQEGEFITIVGPSGCGKSTLLRMLAGHLEPTGGSIVLNGRDITHTPPQRRPMSLVFQSWALFPHMTVEDNIRFPIDVRGDSQPGRVEELLELVQLDPHEHREKKPSQLSMGQQQRVALARSLAYEPEILLLDEPLASLDYLLQKQLQRDLADLNEELGTTFIYVTHSLETALLMSDRVFVIQSGEILQRGSPQAIYRKPVNSFVAEFMGDSNNIEITDVEEENGQVRIFTPEFDGLVSRPDHVDSMDELVIRYDDGLVRSDLNGNPGFEVSVKNILSKGNRMLIEADSVHTGREYVADMTVEAARAENLEKGQHVYFQWEPERAIFVPEA